MKKCFNLFLFSFVYTQLVSQNYLVLQLTDASNMNAISEAIVYINSSPTPLFSNEKGILSLNIDVPKTTVRVSKKGYYDLMWKGTINTDTLINLSLHAIKNTDTLRKIITDDVIVKAIKTNNKTKGSSNTIQESEIEDKNLGQDLTFILNNQQSVVASSDAGNGVGYTNIRIRGTDMSRINFTVNGIPYNDPESQAVFLVDMPDIASSLSNIEIQRGVGTSTNGAASFGASVNLNTNKLQKKPYASLASSIGSFTTIKNSLKFGTGLIKKHFTFDGRVSQLYSKGYIDRAFSKLYSYYISGGFYDKNTILRFNHFNGFETTYQAWNGVDSSTLFSDRRFNTSGTDYGQKNPAYKNEVDYYKQAHYQLFFSQKAKFGAFFNIGLFYIRGKGYYEQYKVQSSLSNYKLPPIFLGTDTIYNTDLIRRRWLDNHFYGLTFSLIYDTPKFLDFTFGGSWNQYDGQHYGKIIWAEFASTSTKEDKYYHNNGLKTDFNVYAKATFSIKNKLHLLADIQYRRVSYNVSGIDNDQKYLFHDVDYNFFNPKCKIQYNINEKHTSFASFGIANREPTRTDFIDRNTQALPETLYDLEIGYTFKHKILSLDFIYYYMKYKNQLVLNGTLNDVGSPLRINVKNSYRTGVEVASIFSFNKYVSLLGNVTWSVNQIKEYADENGTTHTKTKIAYSPQWLGNIGLKITPFKDFIINLNSKVVGEQFIDNSTRSSLKLKRFYQADLAITYTLHSKIVKNIKLRGALYNFTNHYYSSNAYVYYNEAYYFPQAGIHFMLGLQLDF